MALRAPVTLDGSTPLSPSLLQPPPFRARPAVCARPASRERRARFPGVRLVLAATQLEKQPLRQLTQERLNHLAQALGLFERKTVTCVLNLFDSHA